MRILAFLFVLVIFSSCEPNRNVLFITFEDAGDISVGDPVIVSGLKVGDVEATEIDENFQARIKLRLTDKSQYPTDSKFVIRSNDLFSRAVFIEPGRNSRYLTAEDKIRGEKAPDIKLDHIVNWFNEKLENSDAKQAADSIVNELNKLSDKLENIDEYDIKIERKKSN